MRSHKIGSLKVKIHAISVKRQKRLGDRIFQLSKNIESKILKMAIKIQQKEMLLTRKISRVNRWILQFFVSHTSNAIRLGSSM